MSCGATAQEWPHVSPSHLHPHPGWSLSLRPSTRLTESLPGFTDSPHPAAICQHLLPKAHLAGSLHLTQVPGAQHLTMYRGMHPAPSTMLCFDRWTGGKETLVFTSLLGMCGSCVSEGFPRRSSAQPVRGFRPRGLSASREVE